MLSSYRPGDSIEGVPVVAVPHVQSWQVETMRNEVETRLWWFGLAFVVRCLMVGARLRAEAFGVA